MKVLVAVRSAVDPLVFDRVTADGDLVNTQGLERKLGPFDCAAVEAALRLTEDGRCPKARLGEVVAVTVGPPESEAALRSALAMGADRALRIEASDELLDARSVAQVLRTLVMEERPDLILVGKQTADREGCAVGQMLGTLLDYPTVAGVCSMRREQGAILVDQDEDGEGGACTLRVELPAVLSVDLGVMAPRGTYSERTDADFLYYDGTRFVTLPMALQAKRKPLLLRLLDDLAPRTTPSTVHHSFTCPARRPPGVLVASVEDLVTALKRESVVPEGTCPVRS